jgi:hypothetical protein
MTLPPHHSSNAASLRTSSPSLKSACNVCSRGTGPPPSPPPCSSRHFLGADSSQRRRASCRAEPSMSTSTILLGRQPATQDTSHRNTQTKRERERERRSERERERQTGRDRDREREGEDTEGEAGSEEDGKGEAPTNPPVARTLPMTHHAYGENELEQTKTKTKTTTTTTTTMTRTMTMTRTTMTTTATTTTMWLRQGVRRRKPHVSCYTLGHVRSKPQERQHHQPTTTLKQHTPTQQQAERHRPSGRRPVPSVHRRTHALTHSRTQARTHSLTHSLACLLTHARTYARTHTSHTHHAPRTHPHEPAHTQMIRRHTHKRHTQTPNAYPAGATGRLPGHPPAPCSCCRGARTAGT